MRALCLGLLCITLVACASPTATPTLAITPSPTLVVTPSPSPSPGIAFTCPRDVVVASSSPFQLPPFGRQGPGLPSSFCPAEEVAVETAVAALGYPVRSIDILPQGFTCGIPFLSGPAACPIDQAHAAIGAYVTFAATDQVAALTLALIANGPLVATVLAFQVPPSGWTAAPDTTVTLPLGGTHAVVVTIDDQSGLLTGARPAVLPVGTQLPESSGKSNESPASAP